MIRWHWLWLMLGSLTALGCGGEGADDYAALDEPVNVVRPVTRYTPCTEGDTTPCQHIIGEHAGITNCFEGAQTCVEGKWSVCQPLPDPKQPATGTPDTPQELP